MTIAITLLIIAIGAPIIAYCLHRAEAPRDAEWPDEPPTTKARPPRTLIDHGDGSMTLMNLEPGDPADWFRDMPRRAT